MNYQTSRHLWASTHDDRIAITNINSDQRLLLNPEECQRLEAFQKGAPIESEFDKRLETAEIIVPMTSDPTHTFDNPRQKTVQFALDRFLALKQNTSQAAIQRQIPNPLERLAQVRTLCSQELYQPSHSRPLSSRTAWQDFAALFDHLETFLTQDAYDPGPLAFPPGFLLHTARRPLARYDYEQQPCMPATTMARVKYAHQRLTNHSRALILGDDDLIGLYWSEQVSQPADIFELDTELISFLRPRLRLGVTIIERDLTQGLPEEYHGRYDTIFTDPMYRADGMDLFMLCAAQGLAPAPEARIYFSTQPDLIQEGSRFQERLAQAGLAVVEHHRNFSRYPLPNFVRNLIAREFALSPISTQLVTGLLRLPYLYADLFVLKRG